MVKHSTNLILDDSPFYAEEEDIEEALRLAKEADLGGHDQLLRTYWKARQIIPISVQSRSKAAAGHTVGCRYHFPYRRRATDG